MFSKLSVLYLEDETLVALDTSDHLKSLGFSSVKTTYRLANAEKCAAEAEFHLAILDINVDRGQTSIDLGKELAAKGTKVIFASGNSGKAEELRGEGFDFLDKPFSLKDLTRILENVATE